MSRPSNASSIYSEDNSHWRTPSEDSIVFSPGLNHLLQGIPRTSDNPETPGVLQNCSNTDSSINNITDASLDTSTDTSLDINTDTYNRNSITNTIATSITTSPTISRSPSIRSIASAAAGTSTSTATHNRSSVTNTIAIGTTTGPTISKSPSIRSIASTAAGTSTSTATHNRSSITNTIATSTSTSPTISTSPSISTIASTTAGTSTGTSTSTSTSTSNSTSSSPTTNTTPKGTAIMKDIDKVIHSYQSLHLSDTGTKRDTWTILNATDMWALQRNTLELNREALELLRDMSSTSPSENKKKAAEELEYPALRRDIFSRSRYACSHSARTPQPHHHHRRVEDDGLSFNHELFCSQPYLQTYPQGEPEPANDSDPEVCSIGSSVYSNGVPESLYSQEADSTPSQPYSPLTSLASEELPLSVHKQRKPPSLWSTTSYGPPPPRPPPPPPKDVAPTIPRPRPAPYAVLQHAPTPPQAPARAPHRPRTPIKEEKGKLKAGHTRIHIVPDPERPPASSSKPSKTGIAKFAALFTHSNPSPSTVPEKPATRVVTVHTHLAVSTTSLPATGSHPPSRSKSFTSLRSLSSASSSRKPATLAPFCKGAWAIRTASSSDPTRGLTLQSLPDGMYNTYQVWQCKECRFRGAVIPLSSTTANDEGEGEGKQKRRKKGKEQLGIDTEIYTSAVGIRYRWIFLAKSHVRKRNISLSSSSPSPPAVQTRVRSIAQLDPMNTSSLSPATYSCTINGERDHFHANLGCLVCSVEGHESGVYGNVEALMSHIFLEHARGMEERTRRKVRCVVGRVAGRGEEWDLNIPF
ncbi:uncharacterized protein EI97DRAFT_454733 [Westerdykella ornata]|uniref:Uncharacterized protein n=1 Tax=Westerdykella ornata TaxID=318751 RepID=A0A6A6K2E0_WESOR|nr:uncharacterized protein EI97DRAFT_454733 [Westerdykella ornata]KAF2281559.1 hypothetical protein EI97DRAFT_454733 [Westerdykella ornata]